MKKILSYITAFALAASMFSGCTAEPVTGGGDGEGRLVFSMNFGEAEATRADAPENIVVKIGNSRGYTHIYDAGDAIPAELWLVSGNYFIEVSAGTPAAPGWEKNLCYAGRENFVISDGATTSLDVECKVTSTLFSVRFDESIPQWLTGYSVEIFPIEGDSATSLLFDRNNTEAVAYMMLAEGQSRIEWAFEATHAQVGSTIEKTGTFAVEAGKHYTATFKYTERTGEFTLSVTVDETLVEITNDIEIIGHLPAVIGGVDFSQPVPPVDGRKITLTAPAGITGVELSGSLFGAGYDVLAAEDLADYALSIAPIERGYEMSLGWRFFELVANWSPASPGRAAAAPPVTITITAANGKTASEVLTVENVEATTSDVSVYDAWATHAIVKGRALARTGTRFAYRAAGATEWTYATSIVKHDSYAATLVGLTPETEYEFDFEVDDVMVGPIRSFTTEAAPALPNGSFESWQQISNKWYPYGSGETQFWDTANKGLGTSTQPTGFTETNLRAGTTGTRAVEMKAVTYLGQFAAGNLYTGSFGNITLSPMGANVNFGRPFAGRPSSLKGWYKASPGTITNAKAASGKAVGDPDEYQIYVMLTNWTAPRVVNTGNLSTLIDFNADYVIGVGQISDTGVDTKLPVEEWTEFNIPITYKKQNVTPTYIVVVACISRFADYLTGSINSKLWIDDFEFVYDENIVLQQ